MPQVQEEGHLVKVYCTKRTREKTNTLVEESEAPYHQVQTKSHPPFMATMSINEKLVTFEVDTGAIVTVTTSVS